MPENSKEKRKTWTDRQTKRIISELTADPHTLKELTAYITEKYGAVKTAADSDSYKNACDNVRVALLIENAPHLLKTPIPDSLSNLKNVKERELYINQLQTS